MSIRFRPEPALQQRVDDSAIVWPFSLDRGTHPSRSKPEDSPMPVVKEFRDFIARGNVMDLAVGVIIGAAFGKIVTSLVEGIIMPPVGMLLGKIDFSSLFIVLDHTKP